MQEKSHPIKWILLLVLIAGLLLALSSDFLSDLDPDRVERRLRQSGPMVAPLILMIAMILAVMTGIIPSVVLDVAAGSYFGPYLGTLYSTAGALFGAVFSFLIARFLGRGFIEPFLKGHINFCSRCSDRLLSRMVFISRLIPVVSFELVSYGAGLTKMSLRSFVLSTFFGMIPLTFIYNYFGSFLAIGRTFVFLFGLIMVVFFFVLPILIERYDLFSMRRFFQHLDDDQSSS